MTPKPRKRRPRPLIAHLLRPDVWTVAKMIHPSILVVSRETSAVGDRVRSIRREQTLVTQSTPINLLTRKRAWAFRRAETVGKALERLEGKKEWLNVYNRWRMYLQTVAQLTLAIDATRREEEKNIRVLR